MKMPHRRLNNHGVTMVELIISIALISVVMLFMYRLLADVEYDSDNEFYAQQNQTQRIEILDYVQTYISENRYVDIRADGPNIVIQSNIAGDNSKMTIHVEEGGKGVLVENSKTGEKRRWDLENTRCYASSAPVCTPEYTPDTVETLQYEGFILYECSIEIYTINSENKEDNNNTIDDLTFSALTLQS